MTTLPSELVALVKRFARNRDAYHSPAYNETQTRREFIDPLFKALGWDAHNVQQRRLGSAGGRLASCSPLETYIDVA